MPRLARVTPLLGVLLWSSLLRSGGAQDAAGESPAHIAVVDGAALLERDGRAESAPASMPLLAGDRVRTQNGRVEILFADGSTLHLDANSTVDFQSDEVIRLLDGRVRLNIVGAGDANRRVAYRVDAPSAWVQIARSGEYRISVLGGGDGRAAEVELAVLRGAADLVNEDGRTTLGAGERAFARAGAGPSPSYVFNSAAWDTFDRWSEGRRDSRLGVSAEYLPDTVQTYASTFNQYGSWQIKPTYGRVWYPRVRQGCGPTTTAAGRGCGRGDRRGFDRIPGPGQRTISDAGASPRVGRSGSPDGVGARWVSWAVAPGFVTGDRSAGTTAQSLAFPRQRIRVQPVERLDRRAAQGFGHGFVNVTVVNSTQIDVRTRNSSSSAIPPPIIRATPSAFSAPIRSAGGRAAPRRDGDSFRIASASGVSTASTGASASTTTVASDAAAAFRSRRHLPPSTGTAYPAPAREPRSISRSHAARHRRRNPRRRVPSPGRRP